MNQDVPKAKKKNYYPYSDGKPLGESIPQLYWITNLYANLSAYYASNKDVFVGGDNYVYPLQGKRNINVAPDVYVAFGRPPQPRLKSYKVWNQGGIFPQVIVEVISDSNSGKALKVKREFYEKYGCEEYLQIKPYSERLSVWLRDPGGKLQPHSFDIEWTSPRMELRFVHEEDRLVIYEPSGQLFRDMTEQRALTLAEHGRAIAEHERAIAEHQRADAAEADKKRYREKLRELGIDPDTV